MAFAYIREYSQPMQDPSGIVQCASEPGIVDQKIAVGGAATVSAPFNAATRFVRINTDAILSFLVSTTGVAATAANARMAANQTEYFKVNAGDVVSVISNT